MTAAAPPARSTRWSLSQLYLAWRPKDFLCRAPASTCTAGRFTMDVGSRRLVSRSGFRNILACSTACAASGPAADKAKVTGFYTAPVNRAPSDVASALDNEVVLNPTADDTRFGGVARRSAPALSTSSARSTCFDLDEDDGDDAATRNRDLSTFGVRLKRAPKAETFDFDLEYARQTGSVRATTSPADVTDLDHDADMVHAEAGYTFDAPWSPRLSLHYDFASGDSSPADPDSERFDPLFGDRAFEFGPTSIYGSSSAPISTRPASGSSEARQGLANDS